MPPPPLPSITSRPAHPIIETSPTRRSTDLEAGVTFLCKLDAAAFSACTSPQTYSGLAAGSHTFQVEAKDAAGNIGPATAHTWTTDLTPPPAPTITAKPSNPRNVTSPSFTFT